MIPPIPPIPQIISIATDIVGDEKINCFNAFEVGLISMQKIIGEKFDKIKLKRANKVLPFLTVTSSIKIHNTKVVIDLLLLFQRMSVTKKFEDQFAQFLQYELAPYPLALFNDIGMRKTTKSTFYDCFNPIVIELNTATDVFIIDGGFLLHRVVEQRCYFR